MNILRLIGREFVGLFIDDEFLALAVLAVVAASAAVAAVGMPSLAAGSVLLAGCVGVLLISVVRGARRDRRK